MLEALGVSRLLMHVFSTVMLTGADGTIHHAARSELNIEVSEDDSCQT